MTKLSVVIPVFNECLIIQELVKRVKSSVEEITDDYEIVIVDDGSMDSTWEKITSEAKLESRVKGLKFSKNFGHHYAITAGLHQAVGDWVVVMDGDLQDRPEVIPKLYFKAQEGFDVVFVSRQNRPESLHYRIVQKLFYLLLRVISGINFDSSQANFSIISRKVVEAFKCFPENARFYGSTIKWLGYNRTQITADHGERFLGGTSYTLKKRVKLAADIILSFTERPLKFSIGIGIMVSIASFFISVWVVYKSIYSGYSVTGWASLISAIFFSLGIILISIGILGIYIGEIFKQVKNRPMYIIDKEI
jgi:glycosyltransferase involved in cell wall biosynthesis